MAILNLVGFETGDTSEIYSTLTTNGTLAAVTSPKNGGGYALRVQSTNGGSASQVYGTIGGYAASGQHSSMSQATVYVRFWFYTSAAGSSVGGDRIFTALNSSSGTKLGINWTSSRTLTIVDSSGATVTSATTLALNTWHCIELKVPTGTSVTVELRVGGHTYSSGTMNAGAANSALMCFGKFISATYTFTWYYDDICLSDSGWLGIGYVVRQAPSSDGTYTANWSASTGTKVTCIDEVPISSSDTIFSITALAAYTTLVATRANSSIPSDATINGIKGVVNGKSSNTGATIAVRIRKGGADSTTSGVMAIGSYTTIGLIDSSVTGAQLDSLEVGIVKNNSGTFRSDAAAIMNMVDYKPYVAPGTIPVMSNGYIRRRAA